MDSYAKAYGGSKGTRETVRSWGGYAGRHSQSPQQQIKSPRSSTPKSMPTKLELREAGKREATAARTMVEQLVAQRIAQQEGGTLSSASVSQGAVSSTEESTMAATSPGASPPPPSAAAAARTPCPSGVKVVARRMVPAGLSW